MRNTIPSPVLAVVAEISALRETHATLDNLFMYAGAPGDPPLGSKPVKAQDWLRRVNKEASEPLEVLGKIIENYMEAVLDESNDWEKSHIVQREKLSKTLENCDLKYARGGRIIGGLAAPTRTLADFIRDRDLSAIDREFERANSTVISNPREAVSSVSNVLESVCKIYISDENLEMPAKQDLQSVWSVVRKKLGFDPSLVEDDDLRLILSGLISVVQGIGSLRTHASAAHGAGRRTYVLQPRHARLAVHAAHTATLFVLESWEAKK